MNEKQRQAIEEFAQCIMEVYQIGLPFSDNIDRVIEELGGKLERITPECWGYSELYLRTKIWESKFTIKVAPHIRKGTQDYEIARQIGHLFMHTTFVDTIQDDSKALLFTKDVCNSEFGLQANEFAYTLIMPRHEFVQEVRKNTENGKVNMQKVARKFDVNYNDAIYRGKTLELIEF